MSIDVATVLAAVAVFLSAGIALLAIFSLVPATAPHARPLWPTLATELLIVGAVAIAFWIGGPVLLAALLALSFRVGYEAGAVAFGSGGYATRPAYVAGGIGLALSATAMAVPLDTAMLIGLAAILALAAWRLLDRTKPRTEAAAWAEIGIFPLVPTAIFSAASMRPELAGLMVALFLLVETYDSYALLGGKLFGRHPAFPKLSPRKTIEGLVIGAAGLAITAAILGAWLFGLPVLACIVAAVAIGALSTAGDLAASRLKRIAGVKDYPQVMPRQGGLFDIVDAWLLTGAAIATAAVLFGSA